MIQSKTIGNFDVDDKGYMTPVTGEARVAWRERNETEALYHLRQADGHLDEALKHIIAIKLNKLYDGDWASYVQRTFGTSRQNIERHVAHAETLELLRSTTGALLDDLTEGAARPINALDTALRPLAYQIAAGVASHAGLTRPTVIECRAAAEAVTRMVQTGNLNADESAYEHRAANIAQHSRWDIVETFTDPYDAYTWIEREGWYNKNDLDPISHLKIVVYREKPVTDTPPGADAENG